MKFAITSIALAMLFLVTPTSQGFAENAISLGMPVDCVPGKSCAIQKYVDMDPSPSYQDFKCGSLSTDTHKGTDIRLPSYREMEAGVDIFAAADGKVIDIRDGMPDVSSKLMTYEIVTKRGYGNRVAIQHANKFMTVYAHLKRASLKVNVGDIVKKGQKIGQVGMSGLSEYPHLHFELRQGRKIVDPFTGVQIGAGCEQYANSYWDADAQDLLEYNPTFVVSSGFSSVGLNRDAAEYQLYEDVISAKTKTFQFSTYVSGLQAGDKSRIRIIGPDGKTSIFDGTDISNKSYVVRLLSGESKKQGKVLKKGIYTGEFTLTRTGEDIITIVKKVKVN